VSTLLLAPNVAGGRPRHATDGRAHDLLQLAQGAFQKWPEGFAGFEAGLQFRMGERRGEGRVRVWAPAVDVVADDPAVEEALRGLLGDLVDRRTPRFFKDADGRFPIVFDPAAGTEGLVGIRVVAPPAGWLYRIDAGRRVREEERVADGVRTVVRFEALARACPGRVLPARTVRSVTEAVSGRRLRLEVVEEHHVRVGEAWLPAGWRLETAPDPADTLHVDVNDHRLP
jgi:hypothetical protein